ncbi:MAG TPA: GntG family PLP-dependent aldolase [Terriglobia bacterium]|nr:GntG family PLP-dependent aldolase [Terriglobia bacterium]
MNKIIDLRSDTVTQPSSAMRRAMAEAEVGDDVYREDPTVNRLQARSAEIFNREDALFVPSGSMGNQTAIKVHTIPGQEVICEERAHIYSVEMATMAAFSGCLARPIYADDGILTWAHISPHVRPRAENRARTGLVALENTSNLAGGSIYSLTVVEDIVSRTHAAGLPIHLDGARIFNAAVALGKSVAEISGGFDSVMFCFSKGLGAPVGSMLVGSHKFIEEARRVRKILGGGMRQAGVLAAAALIALEESPQRLHVDHANARFLASGLAEIPGVKVNPSKVVSNIMFADISGAGIEASEFSRRLAERGVLANGHAHSIRFVTHCDVSHEDCARALQVIRDVVTVDRSVVSSRA